ncbi:metal-sensing transcriptional repressor [Candidatus Avoscillospira sp. LCP25S3_F1]|uniref:metal-sensing transcriptional repressor n=1 Tax=Candidatus Avoscillospira sp. LCP25S3_F1 TaxID=3438825 RepID=UPI003F904ECC
MAHSHDGDGAGHVHSHGGHPHVHENTKAVLNRLSRAIGHLESVKKMVEDGRDCSEVLVQIAAVRSAINNVGKVILQDHIQHCIVDAVEDNDQEAIENLCQAIDKFVK